MPESMPPRHCKSQMISAAFMLLLAWGLTCFATQAAGQSPPPDATAPAPAPVQEFQGCVQQSPADKTILILSTDTACAKLTGKLPSTDLAGHQIDLKGVLTPRTRTLPASINVDSVISVGKACSDVCSLRPPGTRGLGKGGETPGKEGGTPGEAPGKEGVTPGAVPPQ